MTMRERAAAFFEEHYWNSPMSTTEMLVAFAEAEVRAEREALARAADERLLTSSYILSGAHCNPIAALEAENARLLLVHEFAESAAAQAREHEKMWRDRYADAASDLNRLRAERDEAVGLLRSLEQCCVWSDSMQQWTLYQRVRDLLGPVREVIARTAPAKEDERG